MRNKISANYQLTLHDCLEAKQLYMRQSKDFVFFRVAIVVYFALILLSIYHFKDHDFLVMERYRDYYNLEQTDEERYLMLYLYTFSFFLFIGKIFPKINPLAYWTAKNNLQKNFVKVEQKEISITPEAIAIASKNYRQYHQWQAITKTAENNKIFLLYHSRNKECTIVPKRIFSSEAELINFRHLLNRSH